MRESFDMVMTCSRRSRVFCTQFWPRAPGVSTCQQRPPWSQYLPMADELDGMTTFIAVAETHGFRAAGERLGVSHSAVSQTLRRLEERVGVALVRRTTRSVHLTEAGKRLYDSLRPALDEVRAAVS